MSGIRIGEVTRFFGNLSVAAIALTGTVSVGDTLHFLGATTDFQQPVTSMQIDRAPVQEAQAGQEVAIQVRQRVRPHDKVYRLEGE